MLNANNSDNTFDSANIYIYV